MFISVFNNIITPMNMTLTICSLAYWVEGFYLFSSIYLFIYLFSIKVFSSFTFEIYYLIYPELLIYLHGLMSIIMLKDIYQIP